MSHPPSVLPYFEWSLLKNWVRYAFRSTFMISSQPLAADFSPKHCGISLGVARVNYLNDECWIASLQFEFFK